MRAGLRIVLGVVVLGSLVLAACSSRNAEPLFEAEGLSASADYSYTIPAGTWDRIYAGEEVEILPARLDVNVGEVIRIVNQDGHGHFVGIFYVGAGETVTQRFSSPGEFVGQCTVHPSGELALIVHEG